MDVLGLGIIKSDWSSHVGTQMYVIKARRCYELQRIKHVFHV